MTYGRYVAARIRRDKREDMAADVEATTNEVKETGRAVEDAVEPVQVALALRDAHDSGMDTATQLGRKTVAARSLHAEQELPYMQIYHRGVGYYIAAPLSKTVSRYQELVTRLESNRPKGDAVRSTLVSAIAAGLEGFNQATAALAKARTAFSMARTASDAAFRFRIHGQTRRF